MVRRDGELVGDYEGSESVALDNTKNVLVTFTVPRYGHRKSLKPIYANVARYFKTETSRIVTSADANPAHNKPLAQKHGVSSFPTIKFFGRVRITRQTPWLTAADAMGRRLLNS